MSPSGGLMQLMAYGAQDIYLTSQPQITFFKVNYRRYTNFAMNDYDENDYHMDNCIKEIVRCSRRNYKNFEISQISWPYEKGNLSFTETKYNELCKKYDNMIYLSSADLSIIEFKMVKGNKEIRQNLDKQNKMAKELRENKKQKNKRSDRVSNSLFSYGSIKKDRRNGCPRHHKKFFYGK